jgi:hypothetical protein
MFKSIFQATKLVGCGSLLFAPSFLGARSFQSTTTVYSDKSIEKTFDALRKSNRLFKINTWQAKLSKLRNLHTMHLFACMLEKKSMQKLLVFMKN